MNLNRQQKHTNEPKIQQRVDEDGSATGLKVAELDASMVAGNLKQQPRRQQHEKNQRHENRTPIQHRFRRFILSRASPSKLCHMEIYFSFAL
ncbi:hypothetical protein V6N11_083458 [Hibiscus sabdariffa]|uniref:Uncharacterized protein n=1 Tax=Hibiscus sabdariffa TaxID=183260 RepID=A0ABR2QLX5_9ROSI